MSAAIVLVLRWRQRIDVCAVLADRTVRWVIRDLLEAVEGDPGDWADEPGHHPLVIAEHVHCSTWTITDARRMLDGTDRAESLLHWMREREEALAALGHGNVVRIGTEPALPDGPVHSVTEAAELLSRDRGIDTGMRRLFDALLAHGWIVRRGQEYAPAQSAVDNGLLAVRPRRVPTTGNPWPQIVLTDPGLTELHTLLGGLDRTVLDQEQR